jgi:hypothetical protein
MFKRIRQRGNPSSTLNISTDFSTHSVSVKALQKPRAFAPSKLSLCVAIISCSLAQPLSALGLGEIHSSSILGEQLRARIAVISDDSRLAADEVKVTRVSATEAERLGIDLMSDSRGIRLNTRSTDQGLVVEVSSQQVINEPFLNFVVKLEWPKGSVYREYTLLLDLPIVAPTSSAAQIGVQPIAADTLQPSRSRVGRDRGEGTNRGGAYRVQIGDSLLSLAEQWLLNHPEKANGASLESVAQWLLDNNPNAFAGGDANQLMAGMLLTLPADIEAQVPAMSASATPLTRASTAEAVSDRAQTLMVGGEAALMNAYANFSMRLNADSDQAMRVSPALKSSTSLLAGASEVPAAADLASAVEAGSQSASSSKASRLRLGKAPVSLGENALALSNQGLQDSLESVVQSQLDVTREVIDQLRRDNSDLRAQLTRLEQSDYLNTLSELIRLQGLQLAQLQAKQQSLSLAQAPVDKTVQSNRATTVADNSANASNTMLANVISEAKAAGLVSFAPAASAWSGQGAVNSNRLENTNNRADRAIHLKGDLPVIATAVSAGMLWRWAGLILAPLMLMGVYLLVAIRQRNLYDLASVRDTAIELDNQDFNLERLAELTLAEHTADQAGFSASVEAFHQAEALNSPSDELGLLDRQAIAALLDNGPQLRGENPLALTPLAVDDLFDELDAEPIDQDLNDAFDSAIANNGSDEKIDSSKSAEPSVNIDPLASTTDNVIPFERPRQSDEELKRRIHDKVCDYHPPQPEEASYIVKEGVENIEQYLDIQIIDTPQISLDESRENPRKD